jgi:hypothetical protein
MRSQKLKNDFNLIRNICKVIEPDFFDDENNDCYINKITIYNTGEKLSISVSVAYGIEELAEKCNQPIDIETLFGDGLPDIQQLNFKYKNMCFSESKRCKK